MELHKALKHKKNQKINHSLRFKRNDLRLLGGTYIDHDCFEKALIVLVFLENKYQKEVLASKYSLLLYYLTKNRWPFLQKLSI
jgi:hypothetical protein